jgi:hypothetical protein
MTSLVSTCSAQSRADYSAILRRHVPYLARHLRRLANNVEAANADLSATGELSRASLRRLYRCAALLRALPGDSRSPRTDDLLVYSGLLLGQWVDNLDGGGGWSPVTEAMQPAIAALVQAAAIGRSARDGRP